MELLDRYLEAVRKHLPGDRQDDIIAELRANLESQAEEKEEGLGRPMTRAEVEAWLKELGPPMQMAARYHAPRYLIGPALFPTYWYVLKLVFVWATLVYAIVSVVLFAVGNHGLDAVIEAVLRVPGVLLTSAMWVTAIFAILEFVATRYPEKCPGIVASSVNWSPGSLPPVEKRPEGTAKPGSLASAVAEFIFGVLFLGWLLVVPQHPFWLMGPGIFYFEAHGIVPGPVVMQFYWWVVGLTVLHLVWQAVELAMGAWRRPRVLRRMAVSALVLIPLAVLLGEKHVYLVTTNPAAGQAVLGTGLEQANRGIFIGVVVLAAIMLLQLAIEFGRMEVAAYRRRAGTGR